MLEWLKTGCVEYRAGEEERGGGGKCKALRDMVSIIEEGEAMSLSWVSVAAQNENG